MNSSNLEYQLNYIRQKVLSGSRKYECVKQWKHNHFDIGDILIIKKCDIIDKPHFSSTEDLKGFEVSLDIEYPNSKVSTSNGMTNTFFSVNDWKNLESCLKEVI